MRAGVSHYVVAWVGRQIGGIDFVAEGAEADHRVIAVILTAISTAILVLFLGALLSSVIERLEKGK